MAVRPRLSAPAAGCASSSAGRTAWSQTPQPVLADMRPDLIGQQLQTAGALGPDDVPGKHAAQACTDVLLQPRGDVVGRAGRGEGIDHVVGDQLCAGVHAAVQDGLANALDLVWI